MLATLIQIELNMDRHESLTSIPGIEKSGFNELLSLFEAKKWEELNQYAEALFRAENTTLGRAFILQWAVAAAEIAYNPSRRQTWLDRWREIRGWACEPYCRYLHSYQHAVTSFFNASLREAEALFLTAYDLAQSFGYERGKMRTLFHLGLIERDRLQFDRAQAYFKQAHVIAQASGANEYRKRIENQLDRISSGSTDDKARIERLLLSRDYVAARIEILKAERLRREKRQLRKRESLALYLSLLSQGRDRQKVAAALVKNLMDPVLKLRYLSLKEVLFGLDREEESEAIAHSHQLGIHRVVLSSPLGIEDFRVMGKSIKGIRGESTRKLLLLLVKRNESIDKAELCKEVWGHDYDPVIHDGKIYKLICDVRKKFGVKDLLLNQYGNYRLNPRYLGSA